MKRSSQIGLGAAGVLLVATVWSMTSDSQDENLVYNSLSDCRAAGQLTAQQCETAFSEATDLFRFRTIPGLTVTTEHVILCDDERYEITSVEDMKGRGMYLEALAKRIEAAHG